jgi:hypothetical protein
LGVNGSGQGITPGVDTELEVLLSCDRVREYVIELTNENTEKQKR